MVGREDSSGTVVLSQKLAYKMNQVFQEEVENQKETRVKKLNATMIWSFMREGKGERKNTQPLS